MLRPWVRLLWAGPAMGGAAYREHVLPTGAMHLAIRLDGPPLRLFGGTADALGEPCGHAVVGGVRGTFYAREAGQPGYSVGAQLEPAAARAFFAASAEELSQRHTRLDDLWPADAQRLLEALHAVSSSGQRLAVLERWLLARLRRPPPPHAGVAAAMASLRAGGRVLDAVNASGLSHRHLVLRFRQATGLAPKQYARMLRLQHALRLLQDPGLEIADCAAVAGYADQAHFTRDFGAFAGMSPGTWRRVRPVHAHHVPAPPR